MKLGALLSICLLIFVFISPSIGRADMKVTFPEPEHVGVQQPQNTIMSKGDREAAQKLSDTYAKHIFTTSCFQSRKSLMRPQAKTGVPKMTADELMKACGCLSDSVLSQYSSATVTNYVSTVYGMNPVEPDRKEAAKTTKQRIEERSAEMRRELERGPPIKKQEPPTFSKIAKMSSKSDETKKCGLTP